MKSLSIPPVSDEDELIVHVINRQRWSGFPKVTQISTLKLSPDIDFLQIDDYKKTTIGYEFKLIKYHKGRKRANLMTFYTGIGEALHYFQFGVDRSYLVLGLSNEIPRQSRNSALDKISEFITTFISFKKHYGLNCFGIILLDLSTDKFVELLPATDNLPMMGEEVKHLKNCLLLKQFRYDKKLKEEFLQE